MTIKVRSAGFLSTVQDLGRLRHRQDGVSPSGALDPHALTIANLVVGNDAAAAGLEMTFGNLRLVFSDPRLIGWCGGDFAVEAAGENVPPGHAALIHAGEELRVNAPAAGGRSWMAVSGGIDVPVVLGSRSTDLRSGFGGLGGRALVDGDLLPLPPQTNNAKRFAERLEPSRVSNWSAPSEWAITKPRHAFLRVLRGADWNRFDRNATICLLHESFNVTNESDRMGVRLDGPAIARTGAELLSEPVAPGTIQVPPGGKPIVLLGDCQTIGGYPKIAHVITIDLPAAAQLSAGDVVRFVEVTAAEAQALLVERERELAWFRAGVALKFAWTSPSI